MAKIIAVTECGEFDANGGGGREVKATVPFTSKFLHPPAVVAGVSFVVVAGNNKNGEPSAVTAGEPFDVTAKEFSVLVVTKHGEMPGLLHSVRVIYSATGPVAVE